MISFQVDTFGSPPLDQNANREMFEQGVEVLFKAFEGNPQFSHKGKYYTIPLEVPYCGYIERTHDIRLSRNYGPER